MGILDSLENSPAFKGALGQLEAAVLPVVLVARMKPSLKLAPALSGITRSTGVAKLPAPVAVSFSE